jgi:hypothetical protein
MGTLAYYLVVAVLATALPFVIGQTVKSPRWGCALAGVIPALVLIAGFSAALIILATSSGDPEGRGMPRERSDWGSAAIVVAVAAGFAGVSALAWVLGRRRWR